MRMTMFHLSKNSDFPKEVQIHQLREQLQHLILKIMSDQDWFWSVAFVWWTALRICYDLQRYSEDLDFSLIDGTNYDFLWWTKKITKELKYYGLSVDAKYKQWTIDNCYFRFTNILQEKGLSQIKTQKLSIKIEIDTQAPWWWDLEKHIINTGSSLYPLKTYDLPSLFAGKLHALLWRSFVKGRDWYDLVWYLTQSIIPNYTLLEQATQQTEWKKLRLDKEKIKKLLLDKLDTITMVQLLDDVEYFLMHPSEKNILDISSLQALLHRW